MEARARAREMFVFFKEKNLHKTAEPEPDKEREREKERQRTPRTGGGQEEPGVGVVSKTFRGFSRDARAPVFVGRGFAKGNRESYNYIQPNSETMMNREGVSEGGTPLLARKWYIYNPGKSTHTDRRPVRCLNSLPGF